jgi:phosphatidylserine/phosphatidylglycerophosphate/cardiolipin synthase-like enzyme
MKLKTMGLAGLVLAVVIGAASPGAAASWEVCFTPGGDCTKEIVQAIKSARSAVYVQAFSFTSRPIARALVSAHKHGIHVEVILDQSNRTERYSSADFLTHAGVPTFIDGAHVLAHNKVMVIDGEAVVTGSFNFTFAAQKDNAENVLILHDPELAGRYLDNWKAHRAHSEAYRGR